MSEVKQQSNGLIWAIVFIVGAIMLVWSLSTSRTGQVWVTPTQHAFAQDADGAWVETDAASATSNDIAWTTYAAVPDNELTQEMITSGSATLSWPRTIGLWLSAIFTLCIMSFLVGDNPAYKFAEAMVVGTSAGYVMVIGLWDVFVPNLLGKLAPAMVQGWALPGMDISAGTQLLYIIPAILIVMLLMQLMPTGGWMSRWPIAFFIGITAGYRMIGYVEADLVAQIKAAIVPLYQVGADGTIAVWDTMNACILTIATLSAMIYFFFSIEHKGFVGKTARVGIWFLMITFGASFGYTVMGRIALLAQRLEFLFGDWLHLI
ncbi:MAG: hypothetical protein QGI78_02250 [Phycisphaerales bacterium]|jgi:hypothetical protein|nr:hypothetical protein [Phycisphaerales bacterium]